MGYHSFEQLEVWKRSCRLASEVLKEMQNCKEYSVKDQIIRSALSVPSNIAEGAERNSKREFKQFLRYAKGSAAELRTQLYISLELKVINPEQLKGFVQEIKEISAMLHGLEASLLKTKTEH